MSDYQAVLFDLDGTLIDTAQDMGLALNLLLRHHQRPGFDDHELRPLVSHGSAALINFGFNVKESDEQFIDLRDQFLAIYEQNIAVNSCLFEGMESILQQLEYSDIPWGIVTNKPGKYTNLLLAELSLDKRASTVISGDTLALRKPNPEPLLAACEQIECTPEKCLYVGDALRDIQAARAAGMTACVAIYGYYMDHENPTEWNPDFYIKEPLELNKHINFNNQIGNTV